MKTRRLSGTLSLAREPARTVRGSPLKRWRLPTVLAALVAVVTACGGSSNATGPSGGSNSVGGTMVISSYMGTTWPCQFNPFNAAINFLSVGFVYEPLEFVNILDTNAAGSNDVKPWLATGSTWSNGDKTLTFTIRSGVKWSDGKPFSAADVVYTFNAMRKSPALDLNALWKADGGPLTSVSAQGSNKVVFTFDTPAQTYFYYVADQVPIVPEHIWASLNQSKLATYSDANPVGTGPYLVSNCTQENVEYLRNPSYWQSRPGHPVPRLEQVDYPSFLGNDQANLLLIEGKAQWGAQPIPNIQKSYVAKDPANRHVWFPPVLNVSIFPNLTNPLLKNLAVREAISMAINRSDIATRGESGYEPPANQTGIIVPTYQKYYDSSLNTIRYDPAKAEQVLQAAGFRKGSDGIYQNAQGQLSFTIKTVSGFSDWDASLQIITQELKAVGIQVTVEDENSGPYTTDLETGKFQLAYAGSGGPYVLAGPSPYYELRGTLFSGNIGSTDYERYNSASTDALFNEYAAATSMSQQIQVMHQIEKVMVDYMPFIPVTEGVDWYTYDTSHIGGWPTKSNPYAQPGIYMPLEDNGVILTHLYPQS
jgi:peptide/nickel transport system substrate-binding protein